jgi:NAD(P)-dependent dehydrogenase (short-subunit alcohol dehydrogenase family)
MKSLSPNSKGGNCDPETLGGFMNFLITGAGRGIGFELTKLALADGHNVYALVRNPDKAKDLTELKNRYPSKLRFLKADVRVAEELKQAQTEIKNTPLDVLINNAGILTDSDIRHLTPDELQSVFAVNAPIQVTQTFLQNLKSAPAPKLVNITSLMGSISDNGSGGYYAYRMSKAALNMFAKSFSVDEPSITTLQLHPGWVRTNMGGPQAPVEPVDSAKGLYKVIMTSKPEQSGKFFNYDGRALPW